MSIGTFTLVKNEIAWIEDHVENVARHVDEMVFFDGESTDGTLEYLTGAAKKYPNIKLFPQMDPADLRDDYAAMFNRCMRALNTDWAFFCHPDMWIENPEQFKEIRALQGTAMSTHMTSYGGEPGGQLYRIQAGRCNRWKNIYRLRNPDLGAHYYGWYGAFNEDVYFSEITGDAYNFHGGNFDRYPYEVADSGLNVHHFSDVRPYDRRFGRMVSCLVNQGCDPKRAEELSAGHPRVTLKPTEYFKLTPCDDPRRAKVHV